MFPGTLFHHSERQLHGERITKIIDVDQLSARRERRRKVKRTIKCAFKSFHLPRLHRTHQKHDKDHTDNSTTKAESDHFHHHHHHIAKTLPANQCPFEATMKAEREALVLESPVSVFSMSDVDCDDEEEAESVVTTEHSSTTDVGEDEEGRSLIEDDEEDVWPSLTVDDQLMTIILLLAVINSIWRLDQYDHEKGGDEAVPVLTDDDVENEDHRPELSQALLNEIVHFEWQQQVLEEQPTIERLRWEVPQEMLEEIVARGNNSTKNRQEEVTTLKEAEDATAKASQKKNDEMAALQEKCDNLSTLTELLSKKLVESTLTKKRDQSLKRKETKLFHEMLRQMQVQHRAECSNLISDKKYLEGQLRHTKVESIPPVLEDKSDQALQRRRRRRSFMDSLISPVEVCLGSPIGYTNSQHRASFSMASTMILQNRFLPAMLAAVARGVNLENEQEQ